MDPNSNINYSRKIPPWACLMRRPFLPLFYWNRIYLQHILATYTHSVSIEHTDTQYYCTFPLCISPRIYVYVRFAFILLYILRPMICVNMFIRSLKKHVTRENWDKLSVYFSIYEWWNWPKHQFFQIAKCQMTFLVCPQTRIALHLTNIKWTSGLTAPRLTR